MKKARYFCEAEFQRCSPPCSIEDMDDEFLYQLDSIRHEAGIPLILTSAYRSPEYERGKGRSGSGAHTYGLAVDILCRSSVNRLKIIAAAIKCGIKRIGVGENYIHIDQGDRVGKPAGIWHYYKQ